MDSALRLETDAQTDVDEFTTAALAFRAGQASEDSGESEAALDLFNFAQVLAEPLLGSDNPIVAEYRRAAQQET